MNTERALVSLLVSRGLSQRRACRCLEAKRTSIRYEGRPESPLNVALRAELQVLAQKHRRYGVPRMAAILRRRHGVNRKRVERLWKAEGLPLPKKLKNWRTSTRPWERPAQGTRPNEVWSLDFVHHVTEHGRKMKMLTVIDEFTRECLEIRVEWTMKHETVLETLDELMFERGAPAYLRSDNGSEFIAAPLQRWLREKGVKPIHIEPGHPWQNGYIESFNGKFREECLNQEIFYSRAETQVIVDKFRTAYNNERLHSSLGYQTPAEFIAKKGWIIGASRPNIQGGQNVG